MGHSFRTFLLMFLFICCNSKPAKYGSDHPTVRFSLDGHNFQIGLLTLPPSQEEQSPTTEEATYSFDAETQTFTQYAVIKVVPNTEKPLPVVPSTIAPQVSGNIDKTFKTLKKMKDLYNEFGNLLKVHEKDLLALMDNQKSFTEKYPSSKDTDIHEKISYYARNMPQKDVYIGHGKYSNSKDVNGDNLNIHVHAEPPLRMRTIIGYPKGPQVNNISPSKKHLSRIRIIARDTSPSTPVLDLPYDSTPPENVEPGLPSDEESFLRRGSQLLLSMWKRFQNHKVKSRTDEQDPENFSEELVNEYI